MKKLEEDLPYKIGKIAIVYRENINHCTLRAIGVQGLCIT